MNSPAGIAPQIQKQADEDRSVVEMAQKNAVSAIAESIPESQKLTGIKSYQIAQSIFDAISAGKIPNVKYDIFN